MSKKLLRSELSFGIENGQDGFIHRSWMKNQGLPDDVFDGRPVIGICNSASELTPCNAHLKQVAEYVKRGVWEAGGLPLEFPTMSLGETLLRPTAMLYRNLMAMDVEESIRGNPIDGVVFLAGCDKTTPAQLMGGASVDLPAIMISGGPMLNGKFRGQDVGPGDHWNFMQMLHEGKIDEKQLRGLEADMSRSRGHCSSMGTASTMTNLSEALGMQLTGNAALPAVDARKYTNAHLAGRRIVHMVHEDLKMSKILTRKAFENALKVSAAIGGSTNAIIHFIALARRVGVSLTLDDFADLTKDVPFLVNLKPSGQYLMEDFCYAGGLPAVMKEISHLLHLDAMTVTGKTLGENIQDAENFNTDVIRTAAEPISVGGSTVVLRGNLAPNGAVIKRVAASKHLLKHRGRAVVFETIEDYKSRINDPALDIKPDDIMVLKNCGPKGYPGMPEVGNMHLPQKLMDQGVNDMIRISDARMSGTAFGTVILHVSPEAAVGGTLALVENGDMIEVDVDNNRLHLDVDDATLAKRREKWVAPDLGYERGYVKMYIEHVTQAHEGADLDFLEGHSGDVVTRESH